MSHLGISENELLDLKKNNPNLILIDIRKKEDFAKAHIKGSQLMKLDEDTLLDVPKSSTIVLIGDSEHQSRIIAEKLHEKKFDIYYLVGGIKNWSRGFYCTNINYVGKNYP